jgi:hypothetical protein
MSRVAFRKAKDEQIVNDGVNVTWLLKALRINIGRVGCRWSSHRNPFSSVELDPELAERAAWKDSTSHRQHHQTII